MVNIFLGHMLRGFSRLKLFQCRPLRFSMHASINEDLPDLDSKEAEAILRDRQYAELAGIYRVKLPNVGHNVFVIHPDVKWGPHRKALMSAESQLDEACSLINTLPTWSVIEKKIYSTKRPQSVTVFGSGKFEEISQDIRDSADSTAVMLNVNKLSQPQVNALEKHFNLPVLDRYTVVHKIFQIHARTTLAKLQVALAEIPYLRSQLVSGVEDHGLDRQRGGTGTIGGSGETLLEKQTRLLNNRETKLKRALKKLNRHQHLLKKQRQLRQIPTVAVIGYTNAGKTSLIKALSGDVKIQPRDQLFATLDVTVHPVILPDNLKVLFTDTVGFISDLPVDLMHSFSATLSDAMAADVLIHVRDSSHAESAAQKAEVLATLKSLQLPSQLIETMIEVNNKSDLLDESDLRQSSGDAIAVSCVTGSGLDLLTQRVLDVVVRNTQLRRLRLRVPMAGSHLGWLHRHATVVDTEPCDKDNEHVLVKCIVSQLIIDKFKSTFFNKS